MRSIEAVYKKIQDRNHNLGAYPCLARTVKGRRFSRKNIVLAFRKIVPQDDYTQEDKKGLIDYLEGITNTLEEGEI